VNSFDCGFKHFCLLSDAKCNRTMNGVYSKSIGASIIHDINFMVIRNMFQKLQQFVEDTCIKSSYLEIIIKSASLGCICLNFKIELPYKLNNLCAVKYWYFGT